MLASSSSSLIENSNSSLEHHKKENEHHLVHQHNTVASDTASDMKVLENPNISEPLRNLAFHTSQTKPTETSKAYFQLTCANQTMSPMLRFQDSSLYPSKTFTKSSDIDSRKIVDNESWEVISMGDVMDLDNSLEIPPNKLVNEYIMNTGNHLKQNNRKKSAGSNEKVMSRLKLLRKRRSCSINTDINDIDSEDENSNSLENCHEIENGIALDSTDSGLSSNTEPSSLWEVKNPDNDSKVEYELVKLNEQTFTPIASASSKIPYDKFCYKQMPRIECINLEHVGHASDVEKQVIVGNVCDDSKSLGRFETISSSEDTGNFETCTSIDQHDNENPTSSEVESEIWETLAEELDPDNSSSVEDPSEWEVSALIGPIDEKTCENEYQMDCCIQMPFLENAGNIEINDTKCETNHSNTISISNGIIVDKSLALASLCGNNNTYTTCQSSNTKEEKSQDLGKHVFSRLCDLENAPTLVEDKCINRAHIYDPDFSVENTNDVMKQGFLEKLPTSTRPAHSYKEKKSHEVIASDEEFEYFKGRSSRDYQTPNDDAYRIKRHLYEHCSSEKYSGDIMEHDPLEKLPLPEMKRDNNNEINSPALEFENNKQSFLIDEHPPSDDKSLMNSYVSSYYEKDHCDIMKEESLEKLSLSGSDSCLNQENNYELTSSGEKPDDIYNQANSRKSPAPSDNTTGENFVDFQKKDALPYDSQTNVICPNETNFPQEGYSTDNYKQNYSGKYLIASDDCQSPIHCYETSSSEEDSDDIMKQDSSENTPSSRGDCYMTELDNVELTSSEEESEDFSKQSFSGDISSDDISSCAKDSVDFHKDGSLVESPTQSHSSGNGQLCHHEVKSIEFNSTDRCDENSEKSHTPSDDSFSSDEELVDFWKELSIKGSPTQPEYSCESKEQSESSFDFWKEGCLGKPSSPCFKFRIFPENIESRSSDEESVDFWKQGRLGKSPSPCFIYTRQFKKNESRSSDEESIDFWKQLCLCKSSSPNDNYKEKNMWSRSSDEESIDFWKPGYLGKSPSPNEYYKRKPEYNWSRSSDEESIDFWKQIYLGKSLSPINNYKRQPENTWSRSSDEESIDFWKQGCLAKSPSPSESCNRQSENSWSRSSDEESIDFWKQGCLAKPPSPCSNNQEQSDKYESISAEESIDFWKLDHLENSQSPPDKKYLRQVQIYGFSSSEEVSLVKQASTVGSPPSCEDFNRRQAEDHDDNFFEGTSKAIKNCSNSINLLNNLQLEEQEDSDSTSSEDCSINSTTPNTPQPLMSYSKDNYSKRDSIQLRKIAMPSHRDTLSSNYKGENHEPLLLHSAFENITSNSTASFRLNRETAPSLKQVHDKEDSCHGEIDKSTYFVEQTLNTTVSESTHEIENMDLEDDDDDSCSYEDDSSDDWDTVPDFQSSNGSSTSVINNDEKSTLDETYIIITTQDRDDDEAQFRGLGVYEASCIAEDDSGTDDELEDEEIKSNDLVTSKTSLVQGNVKLKTDPESRAGCPRKKKVDFDLSATSKQDFYEYRRMVKRGKYPKPFDAAKKPSRSVLKHSTPSPINPFFKRAYNISYWTPEVTTTQLLEQMDSIDAET